MKLFFFCCTVIVIIDIFILNYHKFFHSRHQYKYKKAKQIYYKLQSFDSSASIINYLKKIDPFVFEELLLYAFKKNGYKIYRNKRYTGDGGIDGKVKLNNQLYYIQAKRYTDNISQQHVKDFYHLCKKDKVKGYFIHTGKTGYSTKNLINECQNTIELVSGDKLIQLIIKKKT